MALSAIQRDAVLRELTFLDLRDGKGSSRQVEAWREMEWRRCATDPVYFLNTYGWLRSKSGNIERWVLWPVQEQLLQEWYRGDSTVAVKARQLGITTLTIHYFLWKCLFREAAACHVVSYSEDAAKDAMNRLRVTLDRLPEWMLERARRGGEVNEPDRQSKQKGIKQITFGFSSLKILTSTPNAVAGKAGDFCLDEFSRHPDQKRVFDNIVPAFDGGGQLIIIANGQGEDEFFGIYDKAKRHEMPLVPHFFSWRDDPSRDDEWYERTKSYYLRTNSDTDIYDFKAQYPSTEDEAFYITGNSRFSLSTLQGMGLIIRTLPEPRVGYIEMNGDEFGFHTSGRVGRLRLYEEPVAGGTYVIGCDPAGGMAASDYSVLQVCRLIQHDPEAQDALVERFGYMNPPTLEGEPTIIFKPGIGYLEQVATYQAKAEPTDLALNLKRLGRWYNDALAVIELNQHGGTVVDKLKDDYWNIYREVRNERFSDEDTERLGYWSDKHSKTEMIDWLAEWLHAGNLFLRDSPSVTECSRYGYQVTTTGTVKLGAPKGVNDDLVIGLALCVVGARSLLIKRSTSPRKVFKPWEM